MNTRHVLLAAIVSAVSASVTSANVLYSRAAWTADVPPGLHSVECTVTIIDEQTLYVEHFTYDGGGPAVYFYLGATNTSQDFANGLRLAPLLTGTVYNDEALTLTLPAGQTLDGYGAISVWCEAVGVSFGSASFQAPASMYDRAGWTSDIPPGGHDAQGQVTMITDRHLLVEHFTYDGTAPLVYFYLGQTNTHGGFQSGYETQPQLDRAYVDESLVVALPDGVDLDGYGAISVWCALFNVNFSSATFRPDVPGDADNDGDADLADHEIFVDCLAGPEVVPAPSGNSIEQCLGAFDAGDDIDVDLEDFAQVTAG
ncbi:MAG: DM13 domain-containing protein [bacterium]|nr:DM13 domain-containing protein [bacterium]